MPDMEPKTEVGTPVEKKPTYFKRGMVWGLLSGWALIFLPYFLVIVVRDRGIGFLFNGSPEWIYNGSILLLMPVIQGFVGGLMRGAGQQTTGSGFGMVVALWALDTLMAIVFLHEGVICLIMAIPLLWPMIAIGYGIGRAMARWKKSKTVSVSLAPLAMLVVIGETQGPVPNAAAVVSDSLTVNAPPEYVWRYIVDYPENPTPPDYWIWKMGLPVPTHSVASARAVGATRQCLFTGGQSYEERITVLEPDRRLVFDVTKQMTHPEIAGHVNFDQGEITLMPNADGTTQLTMIGRYRLHVRPAAYFDLWAADVTRHIHFRVMGYMKTLAEQDYARDRAQKRRNPI